MTQLPTVGTRSKRKSHRPSRLEKPDLKETVPLKQEFMKATAAAHRLKTELFLLLIRSDSSCTKSKHQSAKRQSLRKESALSAVYSVARSPVVQASQSRNVKMRQVRRKRQHVVVFRSLFVTKVFTCRHRHRAVDKGRNNADAALHSTRAEGVRLPTYCAV